MKRKLVLIVMAALSATVACDKSEPNKEPERPSISITVAPAEIAINGKAVFTVNATQPVEADITIAIKVDKVNVLTLPVLATIKKGEKSTSFDGIGQTEGTVKVTIVSGLDATVKIADATVTVVKEVAAANEMKSSAPNLTFSTAAAGISAVVNLTLTTAVDFDIEIEVDYNFDIYDWADTDGYPTGVTWNEYPVTFPAGATAHSFSIDIEQGNAGTLPLMLISLVGSKAQDIKFEPAEYVFVVTK